MRATLLSVVLAFLMGFAPIVASCCEDHGAVAHKNHHQTGCKHCHSDKKKSEKNAGACNGEKHCVGESSEKQSKVNPAPADSFSGITNDSFAVGFPIVAFLDPQDLLLEPVGNSVPLYLLKKTLRL